MSARRTPAPPPPDDARDDAPAEASEAFETLFGRLEAISAELEAGGLPLDRAIALYEEGVALAERCQAMLFDVEQRIEVLRERVIGTEEDAT